MQYILLLFIFSFSLISGVDAAELAAKSTGLKAAVVDSNKVLNAYPKAQKILKDIAKAEADLNATIQAKNQQLKDAQDQKKTDTELQMLAEQIRLEVEPAARKLEEDSSKKSAEIEADIKKAIDSVMKSSKYDVVLMKQAVLYGGTDISDEVLKQLGAK
jgi:outer membrane protein